MLPAWEVKIITTISQDILDGSDGISLLGIGDLIDKIHLAIPLSAKILNECKRCINSKFSMKGRERKMEMEV